MSSRKINPNTLKLITKQSERLRQVNWGNELHGDFSNAYTNFTKVLDTSLEGCVPNYKSYRNKDNTEATTPEEKAETLNTSFSGNFTDELSQHIPNDSEDFVGEFLDSFVIHPDDVMEKNRKLHPGKTPGPDGWHPIILKNVADIVSKPLSVLFQMSLSESIVPSHWLQAYITAIHKKGAKNLPENYRPVSMTSINCKLMESIVRDNIVNHMTNNDLFSQT